MTSEHLLPYLNLILVLFFITFFADIFYQYFRYRTMVPRKMLSFKRGGLFEHYLIVAAILFLVFILHVGFGFDPFLELNIVSTTISFIITFFTALVFLVFVFIFFMYLGYFIYAKVKNIENRAEFLANKGHKIIMTSFVSALVLATALVTLYAIIV